MKRFWHILFAEQSLVRQSYVWFFLSLCIVPLIFLPSRELLICTYILSCLAITVSSQTFISAASGNKKLVEALTHLEDLVEQMHKVRSDLKDVKAETVESDVVKADKIEVDKLEET